ncbi:hypothetical protein GYA44_02885 [Candidatus Microgenomates bacterium]|jgi:hypothetical protein|nr:hypothetical protein [Candidatus Microgenomates bacterium]
MKIFFLLITILNMVLVYASNVEETYPVDDTQDILSTGISDPTYIANIK